MECGIVYKNNGLFSCLECITVVVSGVQGAATSDVTSVSASPHRVCQSHWLRPRRPHVTSPYPANHHRDTLQAGVKPPF